MPKKNFQYKQLGIDVWYTDSLKGWFIVKEKNQYLVKKGSIISGTTLQLGSKIFKTYQRLGDAKVGIENMLKDRVKSIKQQEDIFNVLQKENNPVKMEKTSNPIDYEELDKEAERLKKKWGLR